MTIYVNSSNDNIDKNATVIEDDDDNDNANLLCSESRQLCCWYGNHFTVGQYVNQ